MQKAGTGNPPFLYLLHSKQRGGMGHPLPMPGLRPINVRGVVTGRL